VTPASRTPSPEPPSALDARAQTGAVGPAAGERSIPRPLRASVQVIAALYAVAILFFVFLARDMTVASLTRDPLFGGYSIAVVLYVLGRFALALMYRPTKDNGHRPSISIIVPAFNEEDGILGTIESCVRARYPKGLVEIVVVNDGSTDQTWKRILEAKRLWPEVHAVHLGDNYGKRGAMAEGIRRSTGDILVFVDSDSYLDVDGLEKLAAPFANSKVGAVVGHAEVKNRDESWLTKMQQVRYYSAFRVIKGTESVLSGTVTCASGCCAAYRRDLVVPLLQDWEFQTFLGRPATFGDDRALTNRILRHHRVVYQSTARADTVAPKSLRVFLRQQLRWKKSWLRENLYIIRYFWRKNPVAAVFTYASVAFPFLAPFVVLHAAVGSLFRGSVGTFWFYVIGTYAMALLYSLWYAVRRPDGLWFHGLTFVAIYMSFLVFQTYWGIATMRDTRWGTRASTVDHGAIDQAKVVAVEPGDTVTGDHPALDLVLDADTADAGDAGDRELITA
jgi:hyaluronan synthase